MQAEHEAMIEEVKANHYRQVQQVVGPLLSSKATSNTIEGTEDQMRKRIITNSYSIKHKQMQNLSPDVLRRQAGGMAMRTQRPPHMENKSIVGSAYDLEVESITGNNLSNVVRAPIPAKAQVQVPRDLIMMNIARKQADISLRNRHRSVAVTQQAHYDSLLQSSQFNERSQIMG